MISSIRPSVLIVALLMGVLGLTGCTAPSMPVTAPSRTASEPIASPPATPQPGPTPTSRVAMTCADVAGLDTLRALTGYDDIVEIGPGDVSFAPGGDLARIAMQRIGALDCEWRSAATTSDADDSALRVQVVADPPQETRDGVSALWASPDPVACDGNVCSALAWSDHYGVTISLQSSPTTSAGDEERIAWATSVVDRVLALPAPAPLWTAIGGGGVRPPSCEEVTAQEAVARLTADPSEQLEFEGPSVQLGLLSAPRYLVGQLDCYWTGADVFFLPGGGWAIESVRALMNGDELIAGEDGMSWSAVSGSDGRRMVVASRGADLVLVGIRDAETDQSMVELAATALAGSA